MGSQDSGVLLSGATSPLLGGDAGDVKYPGYLINGRVKTSPYVFTGKPGQRVRIRKIKPGSARREIDDVRAFVQKGLVVGPRLLLQAHKSRIDIEKLRHGSQRY